MDSNQMESVWLTKDLPNKIDILLKGKEHQYGVFPSSVHQEEIEKITGLTELQFIGEGSFGTVVCGKQTGTETKCAIKLLRAECKAPQKWFAFIKDVKNEIHIMQTMRHENIIKYVSHYKMIDQYYNVPYRFIIKMEHMEYNLAEVFTAQRFDVVKCRAFLCQIGSAVDYLHQNRIAHNDLKPNNIMVKNVNEQLQVGSGTVYKLIDFGLAKIYHTPMNIAVDYSFFGVPLFSPPEKLKGWRYNPFLLDSYGLGCIMLMSIIGRRNFQNIWNDKRCLPPYVVDLFIDNCLLAKIIDYLIESDASKRKFVYQVMEIVNLKSKL